ncbi:GATA zinc finger domain-containing protein 14 isoform X4 [Hydra vulgaris]|uniref:GATA zinc finger domain-containing protein 14 isoform X4 n=1 Tax=Hydra vulgaris TaxID=6087 RepID=A0ABM4BM84_HYDVU
MVSLNGAYSKKYQLQAQESLAQLKDRNQDEEKEKIKILSRQTNEMRRKLERKKKTKEEKEEERRKNILENRRLKQQIATEKFQHFAEPVKQKHVRSASVGTQLKDGRYDVAGYLIDIKNGIRVNSTLVSSANPMNTKLRYAAQNDILGQPTTKSNTLNPPATQSNILNLPSGQSNILNLAGYKSNNFNLPEYLSNNNLNIIKKNQANHIGEKIFSAKTFNNYEGDSSSLESLASNDSLNKNNLNQHSEVSSIKFSESKNGGCQHNNIIDVLPYTTEQLLEQIQKNMLSTISEVTGEDSSSSNKTLCQVNNVAIVSPRVLEKEKIIRDNTCAKRLSNSSTGLSLKDSLDAINNSAINKEASKYMYSTAAVNQEVVKHRYNNVAENQEASKHIFGTAADNQEVFKHSTAITNSSEKVKEDFKHSTAIITKPINQQAFYEQHFHDKTKSVYQQAFHDKKDDKKDALSESLTLKNQPTTSYNQPTTSYNLPTTSYNQPLFLKPSVNVIPTVYSSSSNHVLNQYSKDINSSITNVSKDSVCSFSIPHNGYSSKQSVVSETSIYTTNKPSVVSEASIYSANKVNYFDNSIAKNKFQSDSLETKPYTCNVDQYSERKNSLLQQLDGSSVSSNTINRNEKIGSVFEETTDEIFKQAQQSFAELTFPKMKNESSLNNNFNDAKDIKENGDIKDEVNTEKYDICATVKYGKDFDENANSVPPRYDSNNLKHGRLIVSAESKKKINANFTPHPPMKPKTTIDFAPPSTHYSPISQNSNLILNFDEKVYSGQFNHLSNINSFGKHTRSISSGSTGNNKTELFQKSKVNFSNDPKNLSSSQLSGNKGENSKKQKNIALNKTPTDDEINNLWENVRQCLSAESSGRQAHSDIVPVTQTFYQSPRSYNNGQFYRSLSASSYRRNSSQENSTKQNSFINQNNKGFIGAKNTMGVISVKSTNNIAGRQSLLPQRAVQMIRNPKITNKLDLNQNNVDNLQNNALEELCKHESLTPKQTDVFFHPSMQLKKKFSNVDLSYEERCVMASLDRINKKLEEKEKAMGLHK